MKKILFYIAIIQTLPAGGQNVGIGTSAPAAKLDIRHTSSISDPTLLLYDNSPSNYARLQFQNASGSKYWHMAGYIDDVTDANSRMNFFHSVNGDILSLTGDGKIGIGTIYPAEKLSVLTGNNSYGFSHSNGTVKLASYIGNGTGYFGTATNHPLAFLVNDNTVPMYVSTAGNVGIGSLTPSHRIHIAANSVHGGLVHLFLEETQEDYARMRFQNTVASRYWEIGALPKTADADALMNFYYNNSGTVLSLVGNGDVVATGNYKYLSPKYLVYTLGGADFRTSNNSDNFQVNFMEGSIHMLAGTEPLLAPVHLPSGAVVTTMVVYFYDNNASENLAVNLFAASGVGVGGSVGGVTSSGSPGNTLLIGTVNHTVSNITDSYYLKAESTTGTWTNSTLKINRVQINYTMSSVN